VPPLATGTPDASPGTGRDMPPPAAELFIARARATRADFELTPEAAEAVGAICRRVEGIPLAIELAAAQVATLTPTEIDERLSRDRTLPRVERRGPARQQTMEATLAWSLDILDEPERRLFRRLAVFVGGWSLDAAEQVCALDAEEPDSIHRRLRSLVDHSLVVRTDRGPASRFRFLAPIAESARDRLAASGEEGAVAAAHSRWALATAARRDPGMTHASPRDLDRIALEYENCLAALRWAEQARLVPLVLGLDAALVEYWRVRGLLRDGLGHFETALSLIGSPPSPLRARVLLGVANLGQQVGELGPAREAVLEAIAGSDPETDPIIHRTALAVLGDIEADAGEFEAARAAYDQARRMLDASPDPTALGFWSANMGEIALRQGQLDEAATFLEAARTWLARGQPSWYGGHTLALLGSVSRRRGELVAAFRWLAEGLPELHRYGAFVELIDGLEELGRVMLDDGDPLRAVEVLAAAEALRERTGRVAPPELRRDLRLILDEVHRRIADEAFNPAWERGRELRLEDAIMLAAGRPGPTATPPSGARVDALTPRERQVAGLVASGLTNAAIARELGITNGTARIHVERILNKLGFTSRVQVATWAVREGLEPGEPASQDVRLGEPSVD
jgi:DNA-binding CsgD family transcriptional regulator/tetratricopeptide (TPR) repeat protein